MQFRNLNLIIGFALILLAACAGPFLATEHTRQYLQTSAIPQTWLMTLAKSAHGHASLFGILHICYALSITRNPYQSWQTVGLGLGSFAMSLLLLWRAFSYPTTEFDVLGLAIGLCLAAWLLAITSHIYFLCLGFVQHNQED